MAAFKPGDRVRLVRCGKYTGMEATVLGSGEQFYLDYSGKRAFGFVYDISIDGIGRRDPKDGKEWVAAAYQLEPIKPISLCQQITEMTGLPEGPVRVKEFVYKREAA